MVQSKAVALTGNGDEVAFRSIRHSLKQAIPECGSQHRVRPGNASDQAQTLFRREMIRPGNTML